MKYDETLNMRDCIQNVREVYEQIRDSTEIIPDNDIFAVL